MNIYGDPVSCEQAEVSRADTQPGLRAGETGSKK